MTSAHFIYNSSFACVHWSVQRNPSHVFFFRSFLDVRKRSITGANARLNPRRSGFVTWDRDQVTIHACATPLAPLDHPTYKCIIYIRHSSIKGIKRLAPKVCYPREQHACSISNIGARNASAYSKHHEGKRDTVIHSVHDSIRNDTSYSKILESVSHFGRPPLQGSQPAVWPSVTCWCKEKVFTYLLQESPTIVQWKTQMK